MTVGSEEAGAHRYKTAVGFVALSGVLLFGTKPTLSNALEPVPVVHCAVGEDASGAQSTSEVLPVDLDPDAARGLAFYAAAPAPGVLAPKGWSCHAWQGDSGSFVLVTPKHIEPPYFPLPDVTGAAVLIQTSDRTAGGRFHIAIVASRLFPLAAAEFIEMVKQEHVVSEKSFHPQPFENDQLRYLSDRFAMYTTPANEAGLGTESLFQPGDLPVVGLTYLRLENETEALSEIRIRVPHSQAAAGAAIGRAETVCVQVPTACALRPPTTR